MPTLHPLDLRRSDLQRHLETWVDQALITSEEAESIRAFEDRSAAPATRVPLVAEVLAYLGAALAIAAGAVLIGRIWGDLSPGGRTAVLGTAALLCFLGGVLLRGSAEPALERVSGVLWLLAVVAVAGCAGVAAADLFEASSRTVPIWVGAAATVSAASLYAWRRKTLQQLVLLAGLLTLVTGAWQSPVPAGLSWWVIGGAWAVLGSADRLLPRWTAILLGAVVALSGPMLMVADAEAFAFALGIATACGVLVASVAAGETLLLAPGAVGLFAYLLATIGRYLGDTVGMPIVLLLAGVALLGVAFVTARLRTLTRGRGGAER